MYHNPILQVLLLNNTVCLTGVNRRFRNPAKISENGPSDTLDKNVPILPGLFQKNGVKRYPPFHHGRIALFRGKYASPGKPRPGFEAKRSPHRKKQLTVSLLFYCVMEYLNDKAGGSKYRAFLG
jgi:hypothetical protein